MSQAYQSEHAQSSAAREVGEDVGTHTREPLTQSAGKVGRDMTESVKQSAGRLGRSG